MMAHINEGSYPPDSFIILKPWLKQFYIVITSTIQPT